MAKYIMAKPDQWWVLLTSKYGKGRVQDESINFITGETTSNEKFKGKSASRESLTNWAKKGIKYAEEETARDSVIHLKYSWRARQHRADSARASAAACNGRLAQAPPRAWCRRAQGRRNENDFISQAWSPKAAPQVTSAWQCWVHEWNSCHRKCTLRHKNRNTITTHRNYHHNTFLRACQYQISIAAAQNIQGMWNGNEFHPLLPPNRKWTLHCRRFPVSQISAQSLEFFKSL